MISDPLAMWAVEFDGSQLVAGIDTLKEMRKQFEQAAEASEKFEDSMHKSVLDELRFAWEKGQKQMQAYNDGLLVISNTYQLIYNKTMGWVQAGMAGTAQVAQLGVGMQFLSREIASVFTPTINAVIDKVHSMVDWFRNLSGEQQTLMRNMVFMTVGFTGAISVVNSLYLHVVQLTAGLKAVFLNNPILGITGMFAGILMGSEEGRKSLGELARAFQPLLKAAADIAQAFAPFAELVANIASVLAIALSPFIEGLSEILSKIAPLIAGLVALKLAMIAFNVVAWANPFVLIAAAIAAIGVGIYTAMSSTTKKEERQELSIAGKSFEGVEQTWLRLQETVNKQDMQRRQTEILEQIERNTRTDRQNLRHRLENPPPIQF